MEQCFIRWPTYLRTFVCHRDFSAFVLCSIYIGHINEVVLAFKSRDDLNRSQNVPLGFHVCSRFPISPFYASALSSQEIFLWAALAKNLFVESLSWNRPRMSRDLWLYLLVLPRFLTLLCFSFTIDHSIFLCFSFPIFSSFSCFFSSIIHIRVFITF